MSRIIFRKIFASVATIAYLTYIDANGVSRYACSSQVVTTLNQLSQ